MRLWGPSDSLIQIAQNPTISTFISCFNKDLGPLQLVRFNPSDQESKFPTIRPRCSSIMSYSFPRNVPDTVEASLSPSSYFWHASRRISVETIVSIVRSDPLMTATGLARISRNMVPWHGAASDTAMTSTPSHAADMVHGATSSSAAERKQIHVTLLTAPWLSSSDSNQEHILCEICLDDIQNCRQILRTSCCRLLAHNTCLSRWADTNAQGRLQNGISFTCPKCRTVMDLAKFNQQLPHVIGLAEKLGSGSSYDIDVTFTPLQRPGRLQRRYVRDRLLDSLSARGLGEYSLYQRRIFRSGNEPPRLRRETARLRREMQRTEAQQVILYQYQRLVIEQHRW